MRLASLKAHPDGVRAAAAESEYWLGRSLERWGLLRPPLVLNSRTGNLIDGDRMLARMLAAGIEEAPVWVVDVPEEEEDAAHLALQNHAGEWSWQGVSEHLTALKAAGIDPRVTGFHESDVGPLTAADWKPAAKGPLDGSPADQGVLL